MIATTFIILLIFAVIFFVLVLIDIKKNKKEQEHYKAKTVLSSFLMLLPATILAFLFVLLPIIYSLGYSFTNFYLLKPNDISFIGFKNFVSIFEEFKAHGDIYCALKNTSIFVVLVVPLQIFLALGLALFCSRKVKGVGIFKVCFFAPVVISLTVTSYLWLQILSPSSTGLLNSFLKLFNIAPKDFLREDSAMLWIVLLSAWQGCGYQMLIFLSTLGNIQKDLYEVASLDGANAFQRFIHITMPGLKPTFLYVLITVFIGACRVMVQPMLMTGYRNNTLTLSYYMYTTGYTNRWVGLSSAVALLMTIVIGSITLLQRKFLGDKNQ